MKKIFAVICVVCLLLTMVGCGQTANNETNESDILSTENTEITNTTSDMTETTQTLETTPKSEETTVTTTDNTSTDTTATTKPTTNPQSSTTTQNDKLNGSHIVQVQPKPNYQFSPSDLQYHGKELRVYGNVDDALAKELESTLKKYNKNISLACWKNDGSVAVTYNTNQTYFSACTIKIPVMLYCCKLIDDGKIDKDMLLTYQEKHYHGGSGKIRYESYGTKYTIEYLINQGLSISDNVAYEMIIDYIGHDGFNSMLKELGCDSIIVPNWSIWASNAKVNDFIKLWNEVYEYFKTDTVGAKILKKACTNTPFNYGSQAIKEYDYSHKSGDNFGANCAYNDAGIIWADTAYTYAVFTKSEGEWVDENTVDTAMKIVNKIMTGK